MNTNPNPSQTVVPQKKKRGCLFYGCLTVVILCILGILGIYFGVRYFVTNVVENYSAQAPLPLPTAVPLNIDYSALDERIRTFTRGVKEGSGPKQLILTADEVNLLINRHPDLRPLHDRLYVSMKDNQLSGLLSYPLESFGFPGRYINGEGDFAVKMENGILEVSVISLRVRGDAVPEKLLEALNEKNLAAKLYESPESLEIMKRIEQVKIGEGRLIVERR